MVHKVLALEGFQKSAPSSSSMFWFCYNGFTWKHGCIFGFQSLLSRIKERTKTIKLWIARIIIIAINIWCYCSLIIVTAICNKILTKITQENSCFYKIYFFPLSVILEIKPSTLCMPGKHIPLCYMPSPFFLVLYKMSARGKFQWHTLSSYGISSLCWVKWCPAYGAESSFESNLNCVPCLLR